MRLPTRVPAQDEETRAPADDAATEEAALDALHGDDEVPDGWDEPRVRQTGIDSPTPHSRLRRAARLPGRPGGSAG